MSMGRAPEGAPMSPKPRISMDPVVKYGELYMLGTCSASVNLGSVSYHGLELASQLTLFGLP